MFRLKGKSLHPYLEYFICFTCIFFNLIVILSTLCLMVFEKN